MIDKPEEKKTVKPKKATVKKEPQPKVEEVKETPEPISYKQEGTSLVLKPEEVVSIEEAEAPKEPTPQKPEATEEPAPPTEEKAEEPVAKTLDEQLLDFYNTAEPGNLSLGKVMVQLGVDDPILIKQAWDRLYDQHKVPFSKLFKPPKGYVGFEP